MPLYRKYHPQGWEQVVGQDTPIRIIRTLLDRGPQGRVFWLTANSGQGKTTLANLIAREAAKECAIMELNAQDVTLDCLREYARACRSRVIDGSVHALIVNAAHALRRAVVGYLKTLVDSDEFQRNGLIVCTTTIAEQAQRKFFDERELGHAFLSRAHQIVLNHGDNLILSFAIHAQKVAAAEGLDGQPITAYTRLISECKCNLRLAFQKIEESCMLS